MNKENLLQSAKALKQPGSESVKEYSSKLDVLVSTMNSTMQSREDIDTLVGAHNIQMMKDNHANHARFMESVFNAYEPAVLVDTVLWVFRAYRSRHFSSTYWAAQMNTWIEIYREHLSEQCFKEILPFYKWMQVNIPIFNYLATEDFDAPFSVH